jgi:SAM-dependent methyltransferase
MQQAQFELHADLEQRHWWFRGRQRILARLIDRILPAEQGGSLFELGCGTGGTLAAMDARYQRAGVDPSDEGIRSARARFPGLDLSVWRPGTPLPPALASADAVLLLDVLEHIEDARTALRDVVAAVRPGTRVVITVPADMRLWGEHDVHFGHFRRYEADTLAAEWSGLPVRVRLLSSFNTRLYPVVRAIRTLNRRRGVAAGAAGTDLSMPPAVANRLLEELFASEARALAAAVDNGRRPFSHGVSLVAILEKTP